jgi:flagellar hook-associated protein 2
MASIGLSGLASGVDTSSIIDQLMQIDNKQVSRLQLRQSVFQVGNSQMTDLQTKLTTLKSAATDLASVTTWGSVQNTTSSDPSRVAVTRTGGAPIGGHALQVTQLASSATQTFNWTGPAAAGQLSLGYSGSGTPATINVAAGATAADVASTINGSTDAPVYAAVVNGNQLVLSSRKTGTVGAFTAAGDGLGTAVASSPGKQALFSVDGGPVKASDANVLDGEIPGLKIALKGVTSSPISITIDPPAPDQDKVKAKVQSFVDAYNAVIDATSSRVTEKSVKDAQTTSDASQGQFFGDAGLTGMLNSLRRGMSDQFSTIGNPTTLNALSEIGISTGGLTGSTSADSKMGKLTIDAAKLADALTNDPVSVRRMLAGVNGDGGLSQRVGTMITKTFAPMLSNRITSLQRNSDDLGKTITATQARLSDQETRLKAQFAAMEKAMQDSQTQQSWLSGQISSLG